MRRVPVRARVKSSSTACTRERNPRCRIHSLKVSPLRQPCRSAHCHLLHRLKPAAVTGVITDTMAGPLLLPRLSVSGLGPRSRAVRHMAITMADRLITAGRLITPPHTVMRPRPGRRTGMRIAIRSTGHSIRTAALFSRITDRVNFAGKRPSRTLTGGRRIT